MWETMTSLLKEFATQPEIDARALLSPLRRFPNEMLSEIFLHYCSAETEHPARAPLLVAAVSRKWRQVALSTPALWTSISMTITRPDHVELCKFFLSHSGKRPLEISLIFTNDRCAHYEIESTSETPFIPGGRSIRYKLAPRDDRPLENQVVSLLVPELARWKTFSFSGYRSCDESAKIDAIDSSLRAPLLKEFSLHLHLFGPVPAWATAIIQAGLDNLTNLTWSFPLYHDLDLLSAIQYTQLTNLTLGNGVGISPSQILRIVQQCPLLGTCWMGLLFDEQDIPDALFHCSLHTLTIQIDGNENSLDDVTQLLEHIFGVLTLPALRQITTQILRTTMAVPWPHEAFLAMLKRSHCSMRDLVFQGVAVPADFHTSFTHDSLKDLERLWVQYDLPLSDSDYQFTVPNDIIEALCWRESSKLLPKLYELGVYVNSSQAPLLERMAISRWEGNYSLLRLLAATGDEEKEEMKSFLENMRARRVTFQIEFEPL
ncbi:hypothetical protein C8J56DRAFT_587334 [Mycena floridula]|nr:hypothetical protein C8J56DRAFT_587334 [Mycena floridula]